MIMKEIEAPKSLYYLRINELFSSLPASPKPSQKKDVLEYCVGLFSDLLDNPSNLNELVNLYNFTRVYSYPVPLWLYVLIRFEKMYQNVKTIEDREKRVGKLVDAALSVHELDFRVNSMRSATNACQFFGCYYTARRIASVDPYCGVERDLTIPLSCGIHGAAKKETQMVIGMLDQIPNIEEKINITSGDKGFTALHFACAYSNYDLVNWLLKNGASPNLQDYGGHTPIWHCLPGAEPGIKTEKPRSYGMKIIELLLENNANPHIEDDRGMLFVDHLKKSWRYKEGDFKGIVESIESVSKGCVDAVSPVNYGIVNEVSHERILEHDPKFMDKCLEDKIFSLVRLLRYMAIYDFAVSDVAQVISRGKRNYNKRLSKKDNRRINFTVREVDIFRELSRITFKGDAPFELNTRSKGCRIFPEHSFFEIG